MSRPQKITFGEMRSTDPRCSEYHCSRWTAISGDRWADDVMLSDVEMRFRVRLSPRHASQTVDALLIAVTTNVPSAIHVSGLKLPPPMIPDASLAHGRKKQPSSRRNQADNPNTKIAGSRAINPRMVRFDPTSISMMC